MFKKIFVIIAVIIAIVAMITACGDAPVAEKSATMSKIEFLSERFISGTEKIGTDVGKLSTAAKIKYDELTAK